MLALGLIIGLGCSAVYRAAFGPVDRTDFTVYRAAGQAVLDGSDLYQAHNGRGWYYVYPPPFAILMVPFAKLPIAWGALLWYLILAGLTVWAVHMCAQQAGWVDATESDRLLLHTLPILLVLGYFTSGMARGQASVMMSWLVIAAFYWHFRQRNTLGGISFAAAILLKIIPAVLLAYFVWRKRWRFLAATLAALVVATLLLPALVFGWSKNIDYLHEWVGVVGQPAVARNETRALSSLDEQLLNPGKLRNQSLMAAIGRTTQSPYAREAAAAAAVMMAIAMAGSAQRTQGDAEWLIAATAITWMVLVPPVSESHYFVVLLWPLAMLTAEARNGSTADSRRLAALALGTFSLISFASMGVQSFRIYGLLCWATLGVWTTLLMLTLQRRKIFPLKEPEPDLSALPAENLG